jgi:iron complex transport system substrate-binding protein
MKKEIGVLLCLCAWSGGAWAAVSAIDSDGRRVSLPAPAQRIVSLAPHITELLFAAGAGGKVVAVSEYSDYPEAANHLPRVANSAAVDLERVLALRADLAVAWRLAATTQSLERLPGIGVPVFYSEPHRLAEIPDAIEALGILAGTESVARPAAAALRAELDRLRAAYRDRPALNVYYQISERPLMTVSGQHFISDAIALCGGRNVFADAPLIAPTIGPEAVLAADPDVIIAARPSAADTSWQPYWTRFGALRAVRNANLLTLRSNEMHRHGPRAIAATAQLCALLDEARGRTGFKAASPR